MSLIGTSYFIGDLDIAGLSSQHVRARVEAFIDKYEPKFLRLLFGDLLYADYVAGLLVDPIDEIWTALQSDNLKNALACYVYYWYIRDAETKTTSLGEARPDSQNSTQASGIYKMTRAWNEMIEEISTVYDYLDLNNMLYAKWSITHRYGYYDALGVYHRNYFKPINVLNI